MVKAELLEFVKQYSGRKNFMVDSLAKNHGHTVLQLPLYYCELNPIELIWTNIKGYIKNEIWPSKSRTLTLLYWRS